jgi:superfamily I DNA/RNA helicase
MTIQHEVTVTTDFSRARAELNASGRRRQYEKVSAAMLGWSENGKIQLTRTHHGESRAKVDKYDLGDGYRLITKQAAGTMMFLFVGSHDKADRWLEGHRNYEFVLDGLTRICFVPRTISLDPPSRNRARMDMAADVVERSLLGGLADHVWNQLNITPQQRNTLAAITNIDYETRNSDEILLQLGLPDKVQLCLIDALDAAYRSEHHGIPALIGRLKGTAHAVDGVELQRALNANPVTEEIVTMSDPDKIRDYLSFERWEQWQLFLHQDQHALVEREYSGPARVRGISGSGKTCILVHRAVALARKYKKPIRLVARTRSLTSVLKTLTDSLCGRKRTLRELIHVWTVQQAVIEMIKEYDPRWYEAHCDSDGSTLRFADKLLDKPLRAAVNESGLIEKLRQERAIRNARLNDREVREFAEDEIQFVRTTYTLADRQSYVTARRVGRSLSIGQDARMFLLDVVQQYEAKLEAAKMTDSDGLVLHALAVLQRKLDWGPLLHDSDFDENFSRSLLADESQDFSENILRFLGAATPPIHDSLFLVGDGAQKIFKTGFTFSGAGIDVKGRSTVLRKNYRNTRQILAAAFPLVEAHVNTEAEENITYLEGKPEYSSREGLRPALLEYPSSEHECRAISKMIAESISIGARSPSEILVIPIYPLPNMLRAELESIGVKTTPLSDNPIPTDKPDCVRIGSFEHAKGLEFPAVYIVGLVDGCLPSEGARVRGELWQEAAKLYVGMTRARDVLTLSYHLRHDGYDRTPSMLLDTVRPHCDKPEPQQ